MQRRTPQITDIPPRATRVSAHKNRNTDSVKVASKPAPKTIKLESPHPKGCGLPVGCLFCIGCSIIFVGAALYFLVVAPFVQNMSDQYTTGYGRVSKLQANVGHGGTSTFLSFDLHGYATVVEVFQDTHRNPVAYKGPQLEGNTLIVTLEIVDVNHDGKPDLSIHVENSDVQMVLVNNGEGFQWTTTS